MGRPKTDMDHETGAVASRRGFLKLAAAAPAVAVAAATGAANAETAVERPTSLGLRKTEHVRKYLESCRF